MTALAAQILARVEAMEAVARAAEESGGDWESYGLPDPGPHRWRMTGVGVVGDEMGHRTETMFPADAAHIAANDPAHVLRLCAALREVVELHSGMVRAKRNAPRHEINWGGDGHTVAVEGVRLSVTESDAFLSEWYEPAPPDATLLALASVWDEPGDNT